MFFAHGSSSELQLEFLMVSATAHLNHTATEELENSVQLGPEMPPSFLKSHLLALVAKKANSILGCITERTVSRSRELKSRSSLPLLSTGEATAGGGSECGLLSRRET